MKILYDSTNLGFKAVYLYDKYDNRKIKSFAENDANYYPYKVEIINNRCPNDPHLDYYYWVFEYQYNGKVGKVEKKAW